MRIELKNYFVTSPWKNLKRSQRGRVRPFVLGVIILAAGLVLDKWWWQIGGVLLTVVFVEAFYRYRALD